MTETVTVWKPRSEPQKALLTCPYFEVFFGGARGSLKTDGVLGEWIKHSNKYGADASGLMVRRAREELRQTYRRAQEIYTPLGFKFNDSLHECVSPHGAVLTMAYLERDADAMNYQGQSRTRVYVEEIGNFPSPDPIMKLMAILRSTKGVPVGFRATGNPGGPGHQWVKARYIDPAPDGFKRIVEEFKNPFDGTITERDRVFIPGRITDHNLLGNDYIAQLQMSGSAELVRAWLEGDWSVVEGAYFDNWSEQKHVIKPFEIPKHWLCFRSMDWGSAAPFSVGWRAVASEDHHTKEGTIPKNALVRYREWYGSNKPNVGLKMTAEQVAEGIKERERHDKAKIVYTTADPAMFAQDGGPSLAERMLKSHKTLNIQRADNRRVGKRGAMGGWDLCRHRLDGDGGRPMVYIFSVCKDFRRTVPVLQHDVARPEDLDTSSEDHVADDFRYACTSRPWTKPTNKVKLPDVPVTQPSLKSVLRETQKQQRALRNRF